MAPDTWIFILSFDEQGRPVPFWVRSYAAYDRDGIRDLLNLDGTGPELLQQSWAETHSMPDTRSGYYITTLYQQRGIYWYRADGRHGMRTFPLYESWAILPNTLPKLVESPKLAAEWLSDYGNDPRSGVRSRILSAGAAGIHTGPELGCQLEFIDLVVQDSKSGREIELGDSYAGNPGTLLPKLARALQPVMFTGLRRWPSTNLCEAAAVWAGSGSQSRH